MMEQTYRWTCPFCKERKKGRMQTCGGTRCVTEASKISRGMTMADEKSFHKKKQELRMLHKHVKVGLKKWEDLTERERYLLQKYYGYE